MSKAAVMKQVLIEIKETGSARVNISMFLRSFCFISLFLLGNGASLYGQRWSVEADFPGKARDDGVCFLIGEKAFCGTGLQVGWEASRDFYAFDQEEGSWQEVSPLPSGEERQYANAFATERHGFVFGGLAQGVYLKDLWRYAPEDDEWSEMPQLPAEGRSGASCFRIGDTAYIIGGRTNSKEALAEVWAYDIPKREWSKKGKLPFKGVWNASAASLRGKGYLLFGRDSSGQYKKSLYAYHPGRDSWEMIGSFPGQGRTYSHLWAHRKKLYLLGGMDSTGRIHGDLWHYDTEKKRWKEKPEPPVDGRRGGMGFEHCGGLYYSTGLDTALGRTKKTYKFHSNSGGKKHPTVKLWPNPTTGKLVVHYYQPRSQGRGKYELIDRRGRKVMERPLHRCRFEVDMRGLSQGLYILRIHAGAAPLRKKLIKVDR